MRKRIKNIAQTVCNLENKTLISKRKATTMIPNKIETGSAFYAKDKTFIIVRKISIINPTSKHPLVDVNYMYTTYPKNGDSRHGAKTVTMKNFIENIIATS